MDHFGWLPEQIRHLTPRQIDEYALHPREKDSGAIKRPRPRASGPQTEQEHVATFLAQARAMGITDRAKLAAKVAQIRAHWRGKENGAADGDRPEGTGGA